MPPTVHNPHDKLFKQSFSKKEIAVGFFQAYLPKTVLKHLELDQIEVMPASFIDENLKESHSDLVYQVPLKQKPAFLSHFRTPKHPRSAHGLSLVKI